MIAYVRLLAKSFCPREFDTKLSELIHRLARSPMKRQFCAMVTHVVRWP
jgi:hypothetical protein